MSGCRQSRGEVYMLEPGQTMFYTWDRPNDRRVLRWGLMGHRVKEAKSIYLDKVTMPPQPV